MRTDHVNSTPTLSATVYSMPILFFLLFLIFSLDLHYLPYWELRTDHVNNTPTLLTMVYIVYLYLFLIFSDFLAIFTWITILRNAHRPCKLYLNIINNFTSCLSLFSWFFPDFVAIFILITILGNAHRPCKLYLTLSATWHHVSPFFLIFSWFSHCIYITYHIRKCAQTMSAFIVTSQ